VSPHQFLRGRIMCTAFCFSKLETMHDTVIGFLINKIELGLDIHATLQI
jgi:insertion element IS1 protein InsB